MVQHEQLGAQCSQDSRDDSGFQEGPSPPPPVILCDSPVSLVKSARFLGITITQDLKWWQNISSLTNKAQQRMYFLWQLKTFQLTVKMPAATSHCSRSCTSLRPRDMPPELHLTLLIPDINSSSPFPLARGSGALSSHIRTIKRNTKFKQ